MNTWCSGPQAGRAVAGGNDRGGAWRGCEAAPVLGNQTRVAGRAKGKSTQWHAGWQFKTDPRRCLKVYSKQNDSVIRGFYEKEEDWRQELRPEQRK